MIKKLISITIYILILLITPVASAFGETQNAYLQYNGYQYKFKKGDDIKFSQNADKNMRLFENSQTNTDKMFYLQEALRYYFLLSQADANSINAQIGLGRVFDEANLDRYAKEHFFNAFNMDSHNPKMNLYFADFYYKRNDLINAIHYYNMSYKWGYSNNYYLNYQLGKVYEKLADIESAKKFYKIALKLNPQNNELRNKIGLLEDLNYSQSQYYLFKRK